MEMTFDFERMENLLRSLFCISSLRYSLFNKNGQIACTSSELSPFCKLVNADPEGHSRCEYCDMQAIQRSTGLSRGYYSYRCHAGLVEAVVPVRQYEHTLAYVFFGQMIDPGDLEEKWEKTRALLTWVEKPERYRESFLQLKQADAAQIEAYANVLLACSNYIAMECVLQSPFVADEQLLNKYIMEHYTEPICLDDMVRALSMSKTKLCYIASRQGTTITAMITARRMEEAKRLLRQGDSRIAEVAAYVGINDYNYFTKLFKKHTGFTPKAYYQKHHR